MSLAPLPHAARTDEPSELHLLAFPPSLGATHLPGLDGASTGFWHLGATAVDELPLPADLEAFLSASDGGGAGGGDGSGVGSFGAGGGAGGAGGGGSGAQAKRSAPVCLNFGSMPVYTRSSWIGELLAVLEGHCRCLPPPLP